VIHLHETATTDALDVEALRTAIGPLLEALRAQDVTAEGVRAPGDGRRRRALRLIAGTHPLPGATYRVTESWTSEEDGETVDHVAETDVDVVDDRPEAVSLRAKRVDEETTVAVTLEPAVEPTTCTIDVFGPIEANVVIDLEHLPSSREPQADVSLLHRFFAAEGTVAVAVDATGPAARWRWTIRAEARGRSYVRPVASVAWLFARKRVKAEIDRSLAPALADAVDALNALLAAQTEGAPSVEAGARRTVDAWVDQLPVS